MKQSVRRFLPSSEGKPRALLLGVTPELAEIAWDPPIQLLAVDKSEGMAEGVWPGDTETRRVQVGDWLEIAPILQYQAVQHSTALVELKLVTEQDRPLSAEQEQALTGVLQQALGHPFEVRLTYCEREIPRSAGGKFEEFVCLVR